MSSFDVLLTSGTVVDGTGGIPYAADLGVSDGRIAAIGDLSGADAATRIDARDRLLMPGFVDTHVHADAVLGSVDVQEAMLRQGITSVILGQDGLSFAPASRATVDYVARYFAAVDGTPPAELADGCTVASLLDHYDRRTRINVAYLVPLGTVRHEVLGAGDRPAGDDLPALLRLVGEGLDQGAVGISTGLEYVPGAFADLAELTALCVPAARVGAPYVSHLRSYAGGTAPGMAEAQALGQATGVPVHVSHYRGLAEPLLERLASCTAAGVDVTFDVYPHLFGNTILAMKALPSYVQAGGVEHTLRRLADPDVRKELSATWFPSVQPALAAATFGFVASKEFRWAEGCTLAEASERSGLEFGALVCDVLVASDLAVGAIVPSPGGDETDVQVLIRDDRHMACSDGIYLGGHPHPRGWGAFACFLGHHTRERKDWTWAQAARHLAGLPAERFQLAGRGVLAEGAVADIAVVDPRTVADRATYADPRQLATGVDDVLVAGEPVLTAGTLRDSTPGRALRRGDAGS